jgi:DNA-binding NtrC family response regulator
VDLFAAGGFHAVVTDVRLPDLSGLDVAALCTEVDPDVPVIVITGYGSLESALEAMRRGARDYVQKPFELADLLAILARETAQVEASRDARRIRAQVERRFAPGAFQNVESELARRPPTEVARPAPGGEGVPAAPPAPEGPLPLDEARRRFEVRYVEELLSRTGGNVAAAARLAGISRPNFHKKLRGLGVDPQRFKDAHRRGRNAGL